jgi:hypothetical protein
MVDFIINGILTNPYFIINILWMWTLIKIARIIKEV